MRIFSFVSHRDTYEHKLSPMRLFMETQPVVVGEVSQNEESPTLLEVLARGFAEVIEEPDTDEPTPLFI